MRTHTGKTLKLNSGMFKVKINLEFIKESEVK